MNSFHTHTYRCKHATGDVVDFCEAALKEQMTAIGFSDHAPLPNGRMHSVRMSMEELSDYVSAVRKARETYAGRLKVYLGLELEYIPGEEQYITEELMGKQGMDYLICGCHSYPYPDLNTWQSCFKAEGSCLCALTDYMIASMESGFFFYMAHPDLFGLTLRGWDDTAKDCSRAICQASNAFHVPLEINGYGLRKTPLEDEGVMRPPYPLRRCWEIAAEERVVAVPGADAHRPEHVGLEGVLAFAASCGITLTDPMDLIS